MGQLPTQSIPLPFTDFRGGLNTRDQPYLLTQNMARDLNNLQATAAGALVKRTGLQTLALPTGGLGADPLTSLFALESVSPTVLIGTDSTSIYKISTGGTITSLKAGLSARRWEFVSAPVVSAQGPLFGVNGTDTPQQWNGVAASTSAWTNASGGVAVPNGTFIVYNQNQVFISGVAASPSRVFWSALSDPTNWDAASLTGAGFMDFDPNDGQAITALGVVGPYVLVAKPRKLWVITNVAAATSRMLSNNIGVASHRSLASGPEGTYFLSEDRGVYRTNGSKLEPISDVITPTFQSLNPSLRSQSAGGYFNSHYYLSVPSTAISTANDAVLDYDSQLGSWWKHSISANQFVIWHPSGAGTTASLYAPNAANIALKFNGVQTTGPPVSQCFVPGLFTDNGAAVSWAYRGPWLSPVFYRHKWYETPYYRKRLRQVRVDGYGTVDFSIAFDFAGAETLWQANVLAATAGGTFGAADGTVFGVADGSLFGTASVQRARFYSLGVANAFSIVFSATSSTPDAILSYITMVQPRRDLVVS